MERKIEYWFAWLSYSMYLSVTLQVFGQADIWTCVTIYKCLHTSVGIQITRVHICHLRVHEMCLCTSWPCHQGWDRWRRILPWLKQRRFFCLCLRASSWTKWSFQCRARCHSCTSRPQWCFTFKCKVNQVLRIEEISSCSDAAMLTYLEVSTAFSAYSIWKILPSGESDEHS